MTKMISLEEARELVLSRVTPLEAETVDLLDAAGRVAAADLKSDIDVSPFAHAAMDGYAVRRCDLAGATTESTRYLRAAYSRAPRRLASACAS